MNLTEFTGDITRHTWLVSIIGPAIESLHVQLLPICDDGKVLGWPNAVMNLVSSFGITKSRVREWSLSEVIFAFYVPSATLQTVNEWFDSCLDIT